MRVAGSSAEGLKAQKKSGPAVSGDRRHQFLEAHQVQHPLEVVGQRRETPFTLHLRQALEQKVRVAKPPIGRAEGMFGQRLSY